MTALWLPFQMSDVDSAVTFYTVHLGLSQVDSWNRDGERGAVLRAAGAAYVEVVSAPWVPTGPAPVRFPRGHYGFTLASPGGARLMVWSER